MKKLFFIILFSISYYCNAQLLIGYSEDFITNMIMSDPKLTGFKKQDTDIDEKSISWYNLKLQMQVITYLHNGFSTSLIIVPLSDKALNNLITDANRNYVKISSKKWKYYEKGGKIYDVDLVVFKGKYCMVFQKNEE